MLDEYKQENKIRYAYIILKYFKRHTRQEIEQRLCIDVSAQGRVQHGIISDIAKYAMQDGLISNPKQKGGELI